MRWSYFVGQSEGKIKVDSGWFSRALGCFLDVFRRDRSPVLAPSLGGGEGSLSIGFGRRTKGFPSAGRSWLVSVASRVELQRRLPSGGCTPLRERMPRSARRSFPHAASLSWR